MGSREVAIAERRRAGESRAELAAAFNTTVEAIDLAIVEADPIQALGDLVDDCGLTMTLHGRHIATDDLRAAALESAVDRIVEAVCALAAEAVPHG